jgi:hypothetical protein
MPDLIPHHNPEIIANEGEWTTWEYRGGTVGAQGFTISCLYLATPWKRKRRGTFTHGSPSLTVGEIAATCRPRSCGRCHRR